MITKISCILLKSWILTAMASASLIRRVSGIYLYMTSMELIKHCFELEYLLILSGNLIQTDIPYRLKVRRPKFSSVLYFVGRNNVSSSHAEI